MSKGRYLKAAERACARKARFETVASARAFVEGRYGAYRCVVCGGFHLTSGRGDRPAPPEPLRKEPPGPKLGDLDWSAVTDPKPPQPPPRRLSASTSEPTPTEAEAETPKRTARCAAVCGKDGRVLLVVAGRLVKSAPVDRALRADLDEGTIVEIDAATPPRIVAIV